MKNKKWTRVLQAMLALLLITAMTAGLVVMPSAQATREDGFAINRLDGLKVDYESYLDNSVMYQLPETIRDDEEISVIITLEQINLMDAYEGTDKVMSFQDYATDSEDAQKLREEITADRAELLAKLDEKNIAYTTGEMYDTLLTGYELVIQARDYSAVCQSLNKGSKIVVGEVYKSAEAQLVENTVNVYETGIFKSGESGYDGTGMVVAVLDTGLDSKHTAFSTENFTSTKLGLTYEQVAAVIDQTKAKELAGSLSVDDVYVNEKVPFGYDYADNDPDVYSTHNNHGTHVSGVIVGKDDTITGVAPNAQLVSMKVFSDIMDTARASWILSALEDCVILGVDVINMSLGTACGFGTEGEEEMTSGVYQKIRDAGISLIVAASNSYSSAYGSDKNGNLPLTSNPDTGTVGSPGTYAGAMSVASINGEETPYIEYNDTIIYFDESTNGATKENDFFETLLGDAESKEYEYIVIPGVGRAADYTGMDVTGKIVLVRRGDNTFEEKAMIAESQGAAGIIVYNNVSGEIKMNVGKAKLAVCSISQDDGELLAAAGKGKILISKKQTSGPFISEFSSWGPTPNLGIKPEITAHGGNILSSVTGGGYDRLSGTSMACPNLAGVAILLRQYVVENFPDIANDSCKVNNMVYGLMMSTADIAFGTNGQPYFVRKQGAGLANLMSSIQTPAYLKAYDKSGNLMDKPKLELGDDPNKTGVYEMTFDIVNFGDKKVKYDLGAYVMTEGVSETKTNAGEQTVTEEAVILEGALVEIISVDGGDAKNSTITVDSGATAKVTVKITLTEENKNYLNTSFENGMYVEGFLTLDAKSGTEIDLNVPYLAFFGDWTQAPLFDLDYFDTHADELDDSIAKEDKVMADAYSTRPIGGVSEDYVSYLGSYYFLQDPSDMIISATRDYVALSNQEGTIHSLRFVWAGLLRNAKKVEVVITDDTTGEVVFETVDDDVRKSYGDGGSIYPANIEIEFDTMDYNLANNSKYTVTLTGYLDYGNGGLETNEKSTFSFPLTVDFQAPTITGVEYTYEYDKALKKNRLYANVDIYDNHYAMAAQLAYVGDGADEEGNVVPELKNFEQYMTPIYSQKNSTTTVKLELTDYIYEIKEGVRNKNTFALTCYDYALNYATYEIGLPVDFTDFYFDSIAAEGITISPNEVYTISPLVDPVSEWSELLTFTSSKPSVVRVVNNKLVGVSSGSAIIKVNDPTNSLSKTFKVTVLKENDEGFQRYDKPVADIFRLTGYTTQKAYYVVDNEEKDIGDTGDKRFFEGKFNLEMYPSETVLLTYDLDPYFPKDTTIEFETSNENIVKIDANGNVTAVAEGFASVTVKVMMDGKSTFYSQSVSVEVKDPFLTTGASLSHYYGNGGLVVFPEDLSLTEIGNFAFANFEYIPKTAEELEFDDAETSKQWYIGESTITKVILPEGIEKIGAYAFANLTGLEEIVLPSTLESIEYGAFYGCKALKKITFSGENNLKIISQGAFQECDLQGTLDLSSICVISNYAFAGNQKLEGITTTDTLLSIGEYAFAGCKALKDVTITASKVKYGPYAFTGCESLESFYVNASVLPEGMFYESKKLSSVTIGPDVNEIGEFAFRDTAVETFEVKEGSKSYKVQSADHILSANGAQLVAVAATLKGDYTGAENITSIATGAFSHNKQITSVNMPGVTELGDYAFGSSTELTSVTLGQLTKIGEYAFFETGITQLPQFTAETQIGKYAFANTAITEVTIPDGMTVKEGVFALCKNLETVIIGNDVTLESYAFNMDKDHSFTVLNYDENGKKYFYYVFDSALQNLTIGNNANIGENAFAYHASLTSVTLGENATIGKQAFYSCTSLTDIDLSKAVSIGDYAFSGDEYYICTDENMQYAAVSTEGEYLTTNHATSLKKIDLSAATSIGQYAFAMCESLEDVILGEAITEIPTYAFASCSNLQTINLDKVQTIGEYAFQETEKLETVNVFSATKLSKYAFVNGKALTKVILNPEGTDLEEGAFAYCQVLTEVQNLNAVKNIGDYAFAYSALTKLDLTAAETIGKHAFMRDENFVEPEQPEETEAPTEAPTEVPTEAPTEAPTETPTEAPTEATEASTDVTDAEIEVTEAEIEVTEEEIVATEAPFEPYEPQPTEPAKQSNQKIILGSNLKTIGDNPFALWNLEPFCQTEITDFNGTAKENKNYNYEISDTVRIIDGSLYCDTASGMQLITYAGPDSADAQVADGTVRITAMAFARSDVQMVTMPATTFAIGHKAFFECDELDIVVFGAYEAPIMEEEFDPRYYEVLEHIPGTGDFGTYTDYDGTEVQINGMGLLPYFMWNATDGMYFDVYYGANFKDYVGYVEDKILMVKPVNGTNYDSFILGQYFDVVIDGAQAPSRHTLNTIAAISDIPEKVSYEQKDLVEKARALYSQIGTLEQQALVVNYADLISAEQRIIALTPTEEPTDPVEQEEDGGNGLLILLLIAGGLLLAAAGTGVILRVKNKKENPAEEAPAEIVYQPEDEVETVLILEDEQSEEDQSEEENQ